MERKVFHFMYKPFLINGLTYRSQELDSQKVHFAGLLYPPNASLHGGCACGNQAAAGGRGRGDREGHDVIAMQGTRTSEKGASRANIQSLGQLQKILALGIRSPEKHGHLDLEPLGTTALIDSGQVVPHGTSSAKPPEGT